MGRGEKAKRLFPLSPFPSHHSLLAPYARSQHPSLALLACLACSLVLRARESPNPLLWRRQQVRQCKFSGLVNRPRRSRSQRLLPRIKAFPKNFHRSFPQAVCEGKPVSTPEMPLFTFFSLELTFPAFIPPLIG